jgi:hypothetical protein
VSPFREGFANGCFMGIGIILLVLLLGKCAQWMEAV